MRCIVAIVPRGKAEEVVKIAEKAGASEAVITYVRKAKETLLEHLVEATEEIAIMFCSEENEGSVMRAIVDSEIFEESKAGIVFTVRLEKMVSAHHQIL